MKRVEHNHTRRDLIIASIAVAAIWLAGKYFGLFEAVHGYIHGFGYEKFGGLPLLMLLSAVAAVWFSYRRWQDAAFESEIARRSESELNHAQSIANMGSWHWNMLDDTEQWSEQLYRILGLDPESTVASHEIFLGLVHADDKQKVLDAVEEGKNSGSYDCKFRIVRADHSITFVHSQAEVSFNAAGDAIFMHGTALDISSRKQAELALLESQARFSGIVEQLEDAIISIDSEHRIILFNQAAEEMFGYSRGELLGGSLDLLLPERYRNKHRQGVDTFQNDSGRNSIKRRGSMFGQRKSGEEFPLEMSVSRYGLGSEAIMTASLRDLSGKVKTEEKLRKLSLAIEKAGEAVIITDYNAVIEYVNPAFTEITGYEADEAIGNTPAMLKSEAQDPSFYAELWKTIKSGNVWHGTLIDRKKDGSFYPALMSVSPIYDENREITHYVSLQQDMTEYKKLEGQFLQAQKMEAVGTLVGGIAHDFNNMLAAIQGNIYLARMRMKKGDVDASDEKIGNIEQITFAAAEMVKQLLTFARKDSVSMIDLPLKAYLKEALKLAGSAIPENIELVSSIGEEELHIHGDSTQLQQVVMNLLNNARDAVADVAAPKISVSLSSFDPDNDFLLQHAELSGKTMARLTITDNGCGIPESNLQKVFEPFFTTKGVGKGTGLGLAMVFGVVQRHEGVIEVESSKGSGTTFNIYLPLLNGHVDEQEGQSSGMVMGMNETILLVDDESVLRSTTSELLNSIGYRVLEAGDGQEALQVYAKQYNEISIIITDIVMPKMGGAELAVEVRKLYDDIPIIFVTGYDKDRALSASQGIDCSVVLNKPYNIEYLSHAIREMLTL